MINSNELYPIQKLIYQNKNYDEAISLILASPNAMNIDYQSLLAMAYFYKLDVEKSAKIFKQTNELYKYAYCQFLLKNINEARKLWSKLPISPAQNWSLFFCELFFDKTTTVPSFLQIRAFLERDLNMFLKLTLTEYVQKIIDISDFLFDINPETNKLIAKTFLYNNYPQYAKEYFDRAFDYTNQDAELYYLLGVYNYAIGEISDAKYSFQKALTLNENYIPAKNLLQKISN